MIAKKVKCKIKFWLLPFVIILKHGNFLYWLHNLFKSYIWISLILISILKLVLGFEWNRQTWHRTMTEIYTLNQVLLKELHGELLKYSKQIKDAEKIICRGKSIVVWINPASEICLTTRYKRQITYYFQSIKAIPVGWHTNEKNRGNAIITYTRMNWSVFRNWLWF